MICDYRLAAATYELARKDFQNDKAWRYYASATVDNHFDLSTYRWADSRDLSAWLA